MASIFYDFSSNRGMGGLILRNMILRIINNYLHTDDHV